MSRRAAVAARRRRSRFSDHLIREAPAMPDLFTFTGESYFQIDPRRISPFARPHGYHVEGGLNESEVAAIEAGAAPKFAVNVVLAWHDEGMHTVQVRDRLNANVAHQIKVYGTQADVVAYGIALAEHNGFFTDLDANEELVTP